MIIGITGSIAMGKSSTSLIFSKYNIKIFDADKHIKKLFLRNNIIERIRDLDSQFVKDNKIDHNKIAEKIFENINQLHKLENILYPGLNMELDIFIKSIKYNEIAIIDIPLLFEKNYNNLCDITIMVYCSKYIQTVRALKRKYMNRSKLKMIINNQLHPYIKKLKADYMIYTDRNIFNVKSKINNIIKDIKCV